MLCRHQEDVRRQQLIASEVKGSLDAQVAAVRERQLAEAQREALEVQRMQQHWAQLQVRALQDHSTLLSQTQRLCWPCMPPDMPCLHSW